jgi:hypothetical protein
MVLADWPNPSRLSLASYLLFFFLSLGIATHFGYPWPDLHSWLATFLPREMEYHIKAPREMLFRKKFYVPFSFPRSPSTASSQHKKIPFKSNK